jgi:pyruvate dehydrogenase E2 component (dihydrolipoamide acetyltransferase)
MKTTVMLPDLGENIEAGEVVAQLVKAGETLAAEQPLLELETDKAVVEVPAPRAGRLLQWLVQPGERVAVGAGVCVLEELDSGTVPLEAATPAPSPAEAVAPPGPAERPEAPAAEASAPPADEDLAAAPQTPPGDTAAPAPVAPDSAAPPPLAALGAPASPTVRRLARELGLEIREVPGSGPGGRISREDVKAQAKRLLAAARPVASGGGGLPAENLPDFARFGPVERRPLGNVRRTTAEHLARAWLLAPRVTQQDKADVSRLEELRLSTQRRLDKRQGSEAPRLTMTAILIRVLAQALRVFPQFNASLDMARQEMILKRYCHVGVAVDTDRGLLVPVIRDADRKGILAITTELGSLSARARARRTTPEELQGACITLTNLGGIGGTAFTPIVNHPEVAILGLSRAAVEPVWDGAAFVPRTMLPLSLSYDHRAVDGADGARFLRWIAEALEEPLLLLMDGGEDRP